MLCNQEIIEKTKKIYQPENAFGNPQLIKLNAQLSEPDEDGVIEIRGELEEITEVVRYELRWNCPECGTKHEQENDDEDFEEMQNCTKCKTECKIFF